MTIYRVFTTGGDNDQWIHGLFSTLEKAEVFIATRAAAFKEHPKLYEIEVHRVDTADPLAWSVPHEYVR